MWTEAPSSAALSATAPSAVSMASYRTGTPLLPVRMPRWPIMLPTQRYGSTRTNWTAPRAKSLPARSRCQRRYAASGSGRRRDSASTKPLPQPPRSLQTWTISLTPLPSGAVASPRTYVISAMPSPYGRPLTTGPGWTDGASVPETFTVVVRQRNCPIRGFDRREQRWRRGPTGRPSRSTSWRRAPVSPCGRCVSTAPVVCCRPRSSVRAGSVTTDPTTSRGSR